MGGPVELEPEPEPPGCVADEVWRNERSGEWSLMSNEVSIPRRERREEARFRAELIAAIASAASTPGYRVRVIAFDDEPERACANFEVVRQELRSAGVEGDRIVEWRAPAYLGSWRWLRVGVFPEACFAPPGSADRRVTTCGCASRPSCASAEP